MILEGIVTTEDSNGSVNISPMGPIVDREVTRLRLRPFQTSRTYQNLKRTGEGVFHVTDDVDLLARCAVGLPDPFPRLIRETGVVVGILADACRWYAFRVQSLQDDEPRTTIDCQIHAQGRLRDFWGFNRAKHAVVEAAILATRVGLLDPTDIQSQFEKLSVIVEKTAGDQERHAFLFLEQYVARQTELASQ